MTSTLTFSDVFAAKAEMDKLERAADRRYDQFESIIGPDAGWNEEAFSVVFDSNLTHKQKLAALRKDPLRMVNVPAKLRRLLRPER